MISPSALSAQASGADHARDAGVSAQGYPEPLPLTQEQQQVEAPPDDSLAAAIVQAYLSNPVLAASRYDLRASDDELGLALAQARATVQLQVAGQYDLTLPGRVTQASRSLTDRLNDPNIERNVLTTSLVADQPLYTGGRVSSAVANARAGIEAGREALRGAEGDMLVNLIAAYSDVRMDSRAVAIRETNVRVLEGMLSEVIARREAGELTRTDIAQAETQMQAAQVQLDAARAQYEASRATFAAIVGREPGNLAPGPTLPGLPRTIDAAFEIAEASNPDLREAMARERAARAQIAAARSEARPTLSFQGVAGTNGQAVPFDRRDHDVTFTGRATLTIPLLAGGRVRSLVAQAQNRESADRLRIEAVRRQMVQTIINAWNQWVTAERNVATQSVQLGAAKVYYEGIFEEYREGLRSTFDVLYAQNSLRETELALLSSQRDSYVAQAYLLRQLGQLEAGRLVEGAATYDPAQYTRKAAGRSGIPWGGVIRAIDRLGAPDGKPQSMISPTAVEPAAIPAPPVFARERPLATTGPAATTNNSEKNIPDE
ncbi:TolC family protein [Novosphingobium sp. CF614]|uniref:TolC family protein n=1 Tax=Novosphingobium sp. CF614 TaxID=1884364 RepID=UPI0015A4FAA7|nr:TolC family protein [Novosphingobium sp. CF614]